ncbi:DUF6221 family protein [Streptomyces sp. NPDC016845]|uniref:DUF6221 family protein n=1 Tax=Streptomyces sp. NPDC016845 TaxID=3364972 RepID=UPI0037B9BEDD
MDDLVRWLGEQLDEDTRAASSVHTLDCDIHAHLEGDAESVRATMAMFHQAPGLVCDCGVPARMLREIDGKRRIVDRYAWLREHGDTGGTAWVLPLLALSYAGRPGYREEWRP